MYGQLQEVTRRLPPGYEVVVGSRYQLPAELRRRERRGELALMAPGLVRLNGSEVYGVVRRFRPPAPAWRRPALVAGGTLAGLAVLILVLWTVLSALATVAGGLAVAGMAVAGAILARRGRGGGEVLEVVQRVTVRR